jgi:hypothetical protein
MNKKFWVIPMTSAIMALIAICNENVASASLTLQLGTPNSALSAYTAPFATVTITRLTNNTANIVFQSNRALGYLMGDGNSVALNVNGSGLSWSGNTYVQPAKINGSSPSAPYITGSGAQNVGDFGNMNYALKHFDGATHAFERIEFLLTATAASWASDNDVLIDNADGYKAAAHIFTYTIGAGDNFNDNGVTGFVGNGFVVPEPATVTIWTLLGVAGLVGSRRRKA